MSFDALERIAADESVHAPKSLERKLENAILCEEIVAKKQGIQGRVKLRKAFYGFSAALATAAAAVSIAYYAENRQPADTFSDPHQAYEELQKTLGYISSEMGRGTVLLKSVL